jgi:hypothetical protein
MGKLLAEHWPHLIFVAIGVVAFLWTAYRPGRDGYDPAPRGGDGYGPVARGGEGYGPVARAGDGYGPVARGQVGCDPAPPRVVALAAAAREASAPWPEPEPARPPGSVRRSAARRGLIALGPLLGAMATGAVLYGINVGGRSLPWAVIWVHAGISTLALLLVAYKIGDVGMLRVRRAFGRDRLCDLVSVGLALVSVPLALTGAALLFAPAGGSFLSYIHLITSVWWTVLLAWHLRRYMGASVRAARGSGSENRADFLLEGRDMAADDVPRSVGVPG